MLGAHVVSCEVCSSRSHRSASILSPTLICNCAERATLCVGVLILPRSTRAYVAMHAQQKKHVGAKAHVRVDVCSMYIPCGGRVPRYLQRSKLGLVLGDTLFIHGTSADILWVC